MKTILITGATSGIGLAAAQQLAAGGDRLVLVGRNPHKLADSAELVRAAGAGAVDTLECDFASQSSVRQLAKAVQADYDRIDVLANNAGGYQPTRNETEDGIETTFAVNHLGGYLLTELLTDLLIQSAPARILFTSSVMHYGATLDLADLGFHQGYSGEKAYSRSKLANVLYARALADRLAGTGVTVNAFHPGAVSTGVWDSLPWFAQPLVGLSKRLFFISAAEGAAALTFLATDPSVAEVTGTYFRKTRARTPSRLARDDALGQHLCAVSAALVGLLE
ncbi:SDR family NAD(P)-dependent oxidoreductase [Nocardia sp. NBC_00565]|uniref:SDR family NAD(P)-dependent oxidoreductase n=1 Tax=Nocardia sp. NBC_00565 TaxID=2975993 RepID=UPI002E813AA2|nr:SDR family NAD(P)-dependent oxidoreductase [Nocardia sp. NBC_00565]WUC00299.1 SDR family NAD(P)-dependent oxidoreductase [Nocardia sp. NBC_00565]